MPSKEYAENNYKLLKHDKIYDLPTYDSMFAATLRIALTQKQWRRKELTHAVADSLGLPDDMRGFTYQKSPSENVIEHRVFWAISDMAIAGLLKRPKRGVYQVTDLGKETLSQYGNDIDKNLIHSLPRYLAHQAEINQRNTESKVAQRSSSISDSPDEEIVSTPVQINNLVTEFNNKIATDLLYRIQEAEPVFFERLVVELLSKMGYQGSKGNSKVTQRTNDGGIDGIINQDPLGTQTVYIQAKRYQTGNNVQKPAVQAFRGALEDIHATRGVFITTSDFSEGAKQTAKRQNIVLINGVHLTSLMLQYRVGVESKHHYDVFAIDEDFFDEDE